MNFRSSHVAISAVLALAILAAYAPEFYPWPGNEFIAYDDDLYITDHLQVRAGLTPQSIGWAFSSFHGANWFPLTRLSWMLDAELFGVEAWAFHATSLLLHAAAAVALFAALRRLTGHLWSSAMVAGIFALHPLHVESVVWASYRRDVLSGLCFALALLAYARYVVVSADASLSRGRWRPYAALVGLLALGLMAKPTLVTLPFVLLLLDVWPLARVQRADAPAQLDLNRLRGVVVEKLPLFGLAAIASAVTLAAQGSWEAVQSLDHLSPALRIGNAAESAVWYVAKSVWPSDLAVFYPHPGAKLEVWRAVLAAAALLLATLFAGLGYAKRPYLLVGWLWFLGMLVPVIGLVQVGAQARADRYTYLPMIGLAIAVVFCMRDVIATRPGWRRPVAALAVASLLGFGVATSLQIRVWRDTLTLFEHALSVTTDNYVAHINMGEELVRKQRYRDATAHLVTALRIVPSAAFAHAAMGEMHLRLGRPREAEYHYRRALRKKPRFGVWHGGLAQALYLQDRHPDAVAAYDTALSLESEVPGLHVNFGMVLVRVGRVDEAIDRFERALDLEPDQVDAHANLGVTLVETGKFARARRHLEAALALDPDRALVHAHLGKLLLRMDDGRGAAKHFSSAVRLEPGDPGFVTLLASALDRAGRPREATVQYRRAQQLARESGESDLADAIAEMLHANEAQPRPPTEMDSGPDS